LKKERLFKFLQGYKLCQKKSGEKGRGFQLPDKLEKKGEMQNRTARKIKRRTGPKAFKGNILTVK